MSGRAGVTVVAIATIFLISAGLFHAARLWGRDASASPDWNKPDATAYLAGRAQWWLGWSGAARGSGTACMSCHTSTPIALAIPAVDPRNAAEDALIAGVDKRVASWPSISSDENTGGDACVAFYGDKKQASLGTEAVLNALVLANSDSLRSHGALGASTSRAFDYLWRTQQPDGSWLWLDFGLSPWERDGTYYGTALAAVAVGMAGKGYYDRPDLAPRIAALNAYLRDHYAERPLHDRLVRLWASTWLPGVMTASEKQALIHEVLAARNTDGGWSLARLGMESSGSSEWQSQSVYPSGSVSDGYATGLAVLALERAAVPRDRGDLRAAIAWLAANEQYGTWPASYINGNRDPQSDMGKFMRDAAASYAVMALAEPERPR
jgi:hypothetical protein